MKITYLLLLLGSVFATLVAAGCITPVVSPQLPASLALHVSDLPGTFEITGQTNVTQIKDSWKSDYLGGYYIQFAPVTKSGNITGISQTILDFRTNNLSEIYSVSRDSLQSITGRNVTHLVKPGIGDRSDAFKITDTTGQWDPVDYVIIFSRNGILEQIEVYGPNPDYSSVKNLAEKSAQKIR